MTEEFVPEIAPEITPEPTEDDKLWALLAYIFTPLIQSSFSYWKIKKDRPFIKAHNMQALVLGVGLWIINFALTFIFVGFCTSILTIGLCIYYGVRAYKGEIFEIQ